MLARAVIVLLVVLNLGVAAWWVSGRTAPTDPVAMPEPGVPRLQLLSEVPPAQTPLPPPVNADVAVVTSASTDTDIEATAAQSAAEQAAIDKAAADKAALDKAGLDQAAALAANGGLPGDTRCVALGPFVDDATADAARERLRPQVLRLRDRRVTPTSARGWRVWLPPLADRDAAQAMAARITGAGFSDLFILASDSGSNANAIALGRFGSESSARQREAALRAAGFSDVRAEALDASPPQRWIDIAAAPGIATAALRDTAGAANANTAACATLR